MKFKVKKSVLMEAVERQTKFILENKSTPLMSATFILVEMYENSTKEQKEQFKTVFSLLEKELYLENKEIISLVEKESCMTDESKLIDKKKEEKCEVCKSEVCTCKKDLKDGKLKESDCKVKKG